MSITDYLNELCSAYVFCPGEWEAEAVPQRVIDAAPVFSPGKGVLVLQLNSSASDHPGVHHIEASRPDRPLCTTACSLDRS